MGGKKKYINIFGSFMQPFNCYDIKIVHCWNLYITVTKNFCAQQHGNIWHTLATPQSALSSL